MRNKEPRKLLFKGLGIGLLMFIVIFGYFKYRPIIQGPVLQEISLDSWNITDESAITITGMIKNTHAMNINEHDIPITENNEFKKVIPLMEGKNIVQITLENIFEKQRTYQYYVYSTHADPEYSPTLDQARREKPIETNTQINETETLPETGEISIVPETNEGL